MDCSSGDSLSSSNSSKSRVRAVLRLGGESYSIQSQAGAILSQQLAEVKDESMKILKNFMSSHNVPEEVADDLADSSGEDEVHAVDDKPPKKSKK